MRVHVLTYCDQIEQLYGNLLIFKTIRVGFPDSEIYVVDNASVPAARVEISQQANACGARLIQIEKRISHEMYFNTALLMQPPKSAVFLDPDICFWERVDGWNFDALMAGRLIPQFRCEYTGCVTHPRLHTSFLWIPDVPALVTALRSLCSKYREYAPFRPLMFPDKGQWHRLDTGASEYAALRDNTYAFQEKELDAYDHLFCGTHAWKVGPTLSHEHRIRFENLHQAVQHDHRALRGSWREQEEYFRSRMVEV
jgi:hypothetical protein